MNMLNLMRRSTALLCLAVTPLLGGCDLVTLWQQVERVIAAVSKRPPLTVHDYAAEPLGLPTPEHERLETWYDAPLPAPLAQARVDLARVFFAGDFAALDRVLSAAHEAYVQGRSNSDDLARYSYLIRERGLAGIARCEQWMRAMPRSYAAHWLCGELWQRAAWAARTQEAARKVSAVQFALMDSRLRRSNALLQQAIKLHAKPVQALTTLADNLFLLSDHAQSTATLERVWAMMPAHAAAHQTAARYATPQWGGSIDEVKAVLQRAKRAGVDPDEIAFIEDHRLARPWDTPTPGAEKTYWDKVLAERVTYHRLDDFASYYLRLENWREALPLLDRAIVAAPHAASSYHWRGRVHEAMGNPQAALADYRLAAAMGEERAITHLIYAHLQGGLGLTRRDLDAVAQLCRHAAGLGSPGGANCLGASHWDGSLPQVPRHAGQALAWHLFAARGGNWNSQHDIGWLMMSRKLAEVDVPDARAAGVFWLQRSAEQGHDFAARKLQEAGIALDSESRRRR
jgi:tetratricopeptide (TPR) repeat protein